MRYLCDEKRHLICVPYSVSNLHRMAQKLGIKRCWYHKGRFPHYDIPKLMLPMIKEQCEVVSSKEILIVIREARKSAQKRL